MDKHHHLKQLDIDDEKAIRKVLERMPNRKACIHRLHDLTSIDYPDLLRLLNSMTRKGIILRDPVLDLSKEDRTYSLLTNGKLTVDQFMPERLSPLIGLTELEMRNRVVMLKRMKERLICEWHPIVDKLLQDYERDLRRAEGEREPPDPDDPDILDRDFLQE